MRESERQNIGATETDLRSNRLGLMSAEQIATLESQVDQLQSRISQVIKRSVLQAGAVTSLVVILTFVRVLPLPVSLAIELMIVSVMVTLTTSLNRFVQMLELDCQSEAVRIIKGRTSRFNVRMHPFYHSLRVELHTHKFLDSSLVTEFVTGELYQLYLLPKSDVIIAAELIGEKPTSIVCS